MLAAGPVHCDEIRNGGPRHVLILLSETFEAIGDCGFAAAHLSVLIANSLGDMALLLRVKFASRYCSAAKTGASDPKSSPTM
jgi:hypothetical protein